ncbi:unnamed protein product [Cunninghamella echinulata]
MNNNNNNLSLDMKTYLQQVDDYSQKIYMEGYLMQHKKKYYAELCGSTFTLWDTTRPGNAITPEYIPIVLDIHVYPTTANNNHGHQFILELPHKNKVLKLNTLDPVSLKKWIAAFRLVCFERQLLHQFYTFHLFLQPNTITSTSTSTSSGYLQVLLPNTKNNNEWKKLWVSIIPSSFNTSTTTTSTTTTLKKSKLLGNNNNTNNNNNNKQDTSTTLPQLVLYETKKSKQPLLTLNCIHHAYAVYPEIPSLIHQSTLIRLEGIQNGEMMELLFMADSNQHMVQWLSTLFNAFSLYGLPHSLLQDPMNPSSLNFGDIIPSTFSSDDDHDNDNVNNNHRINPQWWLETDDILQHMDIYSQSTNKHDMYQLFVNALCHKQQQQQSSSLQQHRAKSLPLITVESIDPSRQQRAASDAGLLNEPSVLRSQVADSSDESEDDFEEDDEDEEPDSDDEPIGKSKPLVNKKTATDGSSKETNASSLLIPDFDFGNGFDTSKYESSSLKNEITSTTFSGHSSSTSSPSPSTNRRKSSARPQQRQFSSGSSIISNNSNGSHSHGDRKKSTTTSSPSPSSSSILFGDFSLTADFNKYLDPTLLPKSRTPTPDRKYSLPMKTYSISNSPATSNSSGLDRRRLSWDNQRGDEDGRSHSSGSGSGLLGSGGQHGWDERSPRSRYLDEDYIYGGDDEQEDEDDDEEEDQDRYDDDYDQEGPLIPSLSDHFAPQNSLLDNLLGEQLSAKEQIEYARATGQPLIQVPTKPRPPKGGLVGVISERERHRKQGHNPRVAERVQQHHFDRLEREKERRILEQRQQQFMKHQMMMYAANGYVHPMMMHPYMNPPSPGNNMMPMPPLMSPGSPHTSTSSPITPTSPMPSSPNGLLYGRPYSPSGYYAHPHPHPHYQQQQQPHYFTNGLPMTPNSTQYSARRYSKPLLSEDEDEEQEQEENEDDDEDEPLYTTTTASMINAYHNNHQYPRTASPTTMYHHHRKMNPVPSTSTGNTSIRL